MELIPLEESPIEGANTREEGDSNNTSTGSDVINTEKKRAGLSNELDTTGLTPVKELSSGTIETNLFWGAENLSRAGVGMVGEFDNEDLVTNVTHPRNWFATKTTTDKPTVCQHDGVAHEEVYPMDVVEPEKKPPLILGSGASDLLLSERGCLNTFSPKRLLPGLTNTPAKRSRANNLAHSSASPYLKKAQNYKDEEGVECSNKQKVERKKNFTAKPKKNFTAKPKRIAANFNKVGKGGTAGANQPMIDTVFKKVDDQAAGSGGGDKA